MSAFITGLKELSKLVDESENPEPSTNRVNWLKMASGQSASIRFVNELDEDSPSYDPSRGLALVAYEHTNPDDFRRKAVCTMDSEGRCFGCEMNDRGKEGCYKKKRFYINLLFKAEGEEPKVVTWSMGVRRNPTFAFILEYFKETSGISNLKWLLKRNGMGTDTTWTLMPKAPDAEPFDWGRALLESTGSVEAPNLEAALRKIPYADQEEFYLAVKSEPQQEVAESNIPW